MKAASNSNGKSISAGRGDVKADKEPAKSLRRRKEKTRPLASRKKIISAGKNDRKLENRIPRMRYVSGSSLKCSRTGPSLNSGMEIVEKEVVKLVMTKEPKVSGDIWELLWFMGNRDRYRDMVLSYEGNTVRCKFLREVLEGNDMFIDDLVSGGKLTEVLRYMETRDKDTRKRDDTMVQFLVRGGLYFNSMQKKGEQVNEQQ